MSGPPPVLPYGRQWVSEEDVEAVAAALRSDWLTTGPAVPRFERALAEAVGVPHAVVLNSGTAALHAMYAALGVGPGDEVVTSPLTFAATANAAHYLGARVRFVDVEPRTGNLDPERLDAAIGDKTRLVVAVDFAGHPADYPALQQICDARGVTLVGDASHSLGARLGGTPVGRLCHATVVSMHPVKPITTGEGGAVLTADAAVARAVASFRSHGFERDPDRLENRDEGPWHVEQHVLGFNYRLTDIQAALGASQLTRLEAFLARRAELAARWTAALADLPGLILPEERPGVESGWHGLRRLVLHQHQHGTSRKGMRCLTDSPAQGAARAAACAAIRGCTLARPLRAISLRTYPLRRALARRMDMDIANVICF